MMQNIFGVIKRNYDKTLRGLQQGPIAGIIYEEDVIDHNPSVSRPSVDLTTHKNSNDHDDRYYTQDQLDIILATLARKEEVFTDEDPWVVTHNLGVSPIITIWKETTPAVGFGIQSFGNSIFGGSEQIIEVVYPSIVQENLNEFSITWGENTTGKAVYSG